MSVLGGAGSDDGHGEVVVDVGVHAGDGELDGVQAAVGTAGEQGTPGGFGAAAGRVGVDGGEVEIGEDDVEVLDEAVVVEVAGAEAVPDGLGGAQVDEVEDPDAIIATERIGD